MKVYWEFDPNFFFLLHPSECVCLSPCNDKKILKKKKSIKMEDKGLSPFEIISFYIDKVTFLWNTYPVSTVPYVYVEPYAKEKEMT